MVDLPFSYSWALIKENESAKKKKKEWFACNLALTCLVNTDFPLE